MNAIYRLEEAVLGPLIRALNSGLMSLLVRFAFLAVMFLWLWNSAVSKVYSARDGFSFFPKIGAYGQMFPKQLEAVGYDVTQLSVFYKVVAFVGTWGEFVLPILIIIGLFTRTAAFGMIAFVAVLSFVDIYGHQIGKIDDDTFAKATAAIETYNAKAEGIEDLGKIPLSIRQYVKPAEPVGAWFDGVENSKVVDVRTFWIVAFLILVARGGGWLSVDQLLRRRD